MIAHISDLHFGSRKQSGPWESLGQFLRKEIKPELVLVTGDLADSPKRKLFQAAKKSLDAIGAPRYLVCPGNHDRHTKGNNLGRLWDWLVGSEPEAFNQTFEGFMAGHNEEVVTIGTDPQWRIGIFGLDSSLDAGFSARGYANPEELNLLRGNAPASKADLCFLLVHHHVQSVRKLEENRWAQRAGLFDVMTLVNSGHLLESSCDATINVLLHGHEHAWFWARYGSLENGQGDCCVLGAGSAAGNTAIGCMVETASFNIIVLSPDGSGWLWVFQNGKTGWKIEKRLQLFDGPTLRRWKFLRAEKRDIDHPLRTRLVKQAQFTRKGDIQVRYCFSNLFLHERGEARISNSSGVLQTKAVVVRKDGAECSPQPLTNRGEGDNSWVISWDVDEGFRNIPADFSLEYDWRGGAILTQEDMKLLQRDCPAPGHIRKDGYEYSSIRIPPEIQARSADLFVTIPEELEPNGVELFVFQGETKIPAEASQLRGALVTLGPGSFWLSIPYPSPGRLYVLAWKPPSRPIREDATERLPERHVRVPEQVARALQETAPTRTLAFGSDFTLGVSSSKGNPEMGRWLSDRPMKLSR